MSPGSNNILQRNPALAWREIEDEIVIISPADNVMHELNDTGSFLWKKIDGKRSVADLARLLAEIYDVTAQTALEDTQVLLSELLSRKLVIPAEGAQGEAGH